MSKLIFNENLKNFLEIFNKCYYISHIKNNLTDVLRVAKEDKTRDNLNMLEELKRVKAFKNAIKILNETETELKEHLTEKIKESESLIEYIKKDNKDIYDHDIWWSSDGLKVCSWLHFKKYLLINYNKELKTEILNNSTLKYILSNYLQDEFMPEICGLMSCFHNLSDFIDIFEFIANQIRFKNISLYNEFLNYSNKNEFWQLVAPVYFEFKDQLDKEEVTAIKNNFAELLGSPENIINNLIITYKNKALKIKIQY